jgi:hypothetical protein
LSRWQSRRAPVTLLPGVRRTSRLSFVLGFLFGLVPCLLLGAYAIWGPRDNQIRQHLLGIAAQGQLKSNASDHDPQEDIARLKELQKLDQEENNKLQTLVSNLESENAKLKEELSFFEGFIPGAENTAIALKRVQITPDTIPNQYRYRALLIQGDQKPSKPLKIQLLIKTLNKDKTAIIVLPSAESSQEPQFNIQLTRFARVSGVFSIPSESQLQSVELRILDGKTIRASSVTKF